MTARLPAGVLIAASLVAPPIALAQDTQAAAAGISDGAIRLDGVLDEPAW